MSLALIHTLPKVFVIAALSWAATFGPPRISVKEVTPADKAPAGAVLLVEGHHHQDAAALAITGRAESMQNGRRITMPLVLVDAGNGRFSVARQWSAGTPWVLVLAAGDGNPDAHGVAEALVKIDAAGKVVGIDYPPAGWIAATSKARLTSAEDVAAVLATLASRK